MDDSASFADIYFTCLDIYET